MQKETDDGTSAYCTLVKIDWEMSFAILVGPLDTGQNQYQFFPFLSCVKAQLLLASSAHIPFPSL